MTRGVICKCKRNALNVRQCLFALSDAPESHLEKGEQNNRNVRQCPSRMWEFGCVVSQGTLCL